ncbi:MAG: DUF433 domain-containing protein [Geminicoccaceae bacterium]
MAARLVDRIVSDPRVMMGKPIVKGTHIPVELILRRLGAGDSEAQILADYPALSIEDIRAAQAHGWQIERIEEGLAAAREGRLRPAEEVVDEIAKRHGFGR